MKLSDDLLRKVAIAIEGTCDSVDVVLERLEIEGDAEDIEDQLLDENIQSCAGCGWWYECCELDDDGRCKDCGGVFE